MLIKKQYIGKVNVDNEERTVTAVINTGAIDRDNEVLLPKGAVLTQYKKNPVVLWAHDYRDTPIGKAIWIKRDSDSITAKVKFPNEGKSAKADEVYDLFKGGFIKAFSVGFKPLKSHAPEPDEIKKIPEWASVHRVYDKWELLEFSAVPVPANPEALVTAVKSHDVELSEETIDDFNNKDFFEDVFEEDEECIVNSKESEDCKEIEPAITKLSFQQQQKRLKLQPKLRMRSFNSIGEAIESIGEDINKIINNSIDRRKGKVY